MKERHKETGRLAASALLTLAVCAGAWAAACRDWNGAGMADEQIRQQISARRQQEEEIRMQGGQAAGTPTPEPMAVSGPALTPGADAEKTERKPTVRRKQKIKSTRSRTVPARYIESCALPRRVQREIFRICGEAGVSFEFVMALIERESGWNTHCLSDAGESAGLMQVQEKWHAGLMDKLGCTDLYDPVQNVTVGVEILKGCLAEYGDAAAALMAYNGGSAYAEKMLDAGEVSAYAAGILSRAAEYERGNGL